MWQQPHKSQGELNLIGLTGRRLTFYMGWCMAGGTFGATGRNLINTKCGTTHTIKNFAFHQKIISAPPIFMGSLIINFSFYKRHRSFAYGRNGDGYVPNPLSRYLPLICQCTIHSVWSQRWPGTDYTDKSFFGRGWPTREADDSK